MELLAVLVVLAAVSAVATLATRAIDREGPEDPELQVVRLRAKALESGRPLTAVISVAGRPLDVTAYPDGHVDADSGLRIERLNGAITPENQ